MANLGSRRVQQPDGKFRPLRDKAEISKLRSPRRALAIDHEGEPSLRVHGIPLTPQPLHRGNPVVQSVKVVVADPVRLAIAHHVVVFCGVDSLFVEDVPALHADTTIGIGEVFIGIAGAAARGMSTIMNVAEFVGESPRGRLSAISQAHTRLELGIAGIGDSVGQSRSAAKLAEVLLRLGRRHHPEDRRVKRNIPLHPQVRDHRQEVAEARPIREHLDV